MGYKNRQQAIKNVKISLDYTELVQMLSRFQTAKYNVLPTMLANFQIQDVLDSLARWPPWLSK